MTQREIAEVDSDPVRTLIGMPLPFSDQEYGERVEAARRELEVAQLDAILLFHQESMYYLFGYDQVGYWVYQTALLTSCHDEIDIVCRSADIDLVTGLPFVGHISTWRDDCGDDPISLTIAALKRVNAFARGSRVGIELRSHALLAQYFEELRRLCAEHSVELVDASDLVTELRVTKSPREIEYVRQAARVMDAGYEAAFAAMVPGNRELDVLEAVLSAMFKHGGEVPAIIPPIASGPRTISRTHGAASSRVMAERDIVMIEVGGCFRRYHAVGAQTRFLGSPPAAVRDTHQMLKDAVAAGFEAIKPGLPVADLAATVNAELSKHALHVEGRHAGYGTGIGYPPTWLDNLRIKASDEHLLVPGVVFFLATYHSLLDDALGLVEVVVGEPILVTEAGPERLSRIELLLA